MRSYLLYTFLFVIAFSCNKESGVNPASSKTFVRYFNGGVDDVAETVQETPDGGYLILANSTIKPNEVTGAHYKVKLIKTDAYGNLVWQKVYPEYSSDTYTGPNPLNGNTTTFKYSYAGHGLLVLPNGGGYVVVGEDIKNDTSSLFIMTTDLDGNNFKSNSIKANANVRARGVVLNPGDLKNNNAGKDNYLVLSQSNNAMILTEFNKTTLAPVWSRNYSAGKVDNLVNKVFTNSSGTVYWGGTVTKNIGTTSKIRFIKTNQNSDLVESDPVIGTPAFNETGNDLCRYGFGFAVIGTTDEKVNNGTSTAGDLDILFKRLAEDGSEIQGQTKSFKITGADGNDLGQNEEGNAITATQDGGLLLLGTVDSQGVVDTRGNIGRGDKDYYLIKINAFGEVEWTQVYGSKFEDKGAAAIQASDGGLIVLGNANLANTKTVMLMKTDKEGMIE